MFNLANMLSVMFVVDLPYPSGIRLTFKCQRRINKIVCNAASLRDRLYIVSENTNIVYAIHQSSETVVELTVERLQSPMDIVACKTTGCLYISDGVNCSVWKIEKK